MTEVFIKKEEKVVPEKKVRVLAGDENSNFSFNGNHQDFKEESKDYSLELNPSSELVLKDSFSCLEPQFCQENSNSQLRFYT